MSSHKTFSCGTPARPTSMPSSRTLASHARWTILGDSQLAASWERSGTWRPRSWRACPARQPRDQYSLGCVAFELLTGHLPSDGHDPDVTPLEDSTRSRRLRGRVSARVLQDDRARSGRGSGVIGFRIFARSSSRTLPPREPSRALSRSLKPSPVPAQTLTSSRPFIRDMVSVRPRSPRSPTLRRLK